MVVISVAVSICATFIFSGYAAHKRLMQSAYDLGVEIGRGKCLTSPPFKEPR